MELQDEDIQRVQPVKRKARRRPNYLIMDNEQLMVPGNIYQSWLQDTSDIASKRGRTVKVCAEPLLFSSSVHYPKNSLFFFLFLQSTDQFVYLAMFAIS